MSEWTELDNELLEAARVGNSELIRLLLSVKDSDGNFLIDVVDYADSIIKWATRNGHKEIVKLLKERWS